MKTFINIFLLLTLISGYVFGYECPPLKWKKAGTEFGFVPSIITDHSDTSFFCSNKNRNLIVDKRDGSIIGTKDGFVLHSNSRTYEGGFIVYDNNKITVTNNNLDELWSKVIDSSSLLSVTQTHDSGYAALNAAKNGYEIIILSKNGNITTKFPLEKNIPYIDSSFNIDYKGIVKTNGGIVAYGIGRTSTSIFSDGIASKYSLSGTEIWLKILSGIEISDIIELDNGEIAFTGRTDPNSAGIIDTLFFTQKLAKRLYFPDYSVPLIHLDSDGKVLLHKELGIFEFEQGQSLRKLNNLFFITYYSSMNNGSLAAYDIYAVNDSGNTVWSNTNLIPNNSVSFRITAQPFLSGDIAPV